MDLPVLLQRAGQRVSNLRIEMAVSHKPAGAIDRQQHSAVRRETEELHDEIVVGAGEKKDGGEGLAILIFEAQAAGAKRPHIHAVRGHRLEAEPCQFIDGGLLDRCKLGLRNNGGVLHRPEGHAQHRDEHGDEAEREKCHERQDGNARYSLKLTHRHTPSASLRRLEHRAVPRQIGLSAPAKRRPCGNTRHGMEGNLLKPVRFRWNQKRVLSFCFAVRLCRKTAPRLCGRTLARGY